MGPLHLCQLCLSLKHSMSKTKHKDCSKSSQKLSLHTICNLQLNLVILQLADFVSRGKETKTRPHTDTYTCNTVSVQIKAVQNSQIDISYTVFGRISTNFLTSVISTKLSVFHWVAVILLGHQLQNYLINNFSKFYCCTVHCACNEIAWLPGQRQDTEITLHWLIHLVARASMLALQVKTQDRNCIRSLRTTRGMYDSLTGSKITRFHCIQNPQ